MRILRGALVLLVALAGLWTSADAARADGADKWLPESTAVYVSVDNVKATSERLGTHPLKALWDEPKMQKFLEGPLGKLEELMEEGTAEMGGASPMDVLKLVEGQAVLAVTGLRDVEGGGRKIGLLVLADVGADSADPVNEWIRKVETSLLEKQRMRRLEDEFRGVKIVRYEPKEPRTVEPGDVDFGPLCWCLADGILGVCADPEVLKDVLARKNAGEGASLATHAGYRRVREVAGTGDLFVYVSGTTIWDTAKRIAGSGREATQVFKVLETLGLKAVQAFGIRASLTPQGVETRGFLLSPPPHRGIVKFLDSENSALTFPRFVPADVQSAVVAAVDFQAVWKEARKVIDQFEPGTTASLDENFAQMKEGGIDVEGDVIGALGKSVVVYQLAPVKKAGPAEKPTTPGKEAEGDEDPGMPHVAEMPEMPRMVFAIELSKPAALAGVLAKLVPEMGMGLEAQEYMGTSLWMAGEQTFPPIGAGVIGNHLVIAFHADDLKHVVRAQGQAEAGSLVAAPEFQKALEGLPASRTVLSYSDPRRALDEVRGATDMLGAMPFNLDWLNLSIFPYELVKTYMNVGGGTATRESDGFSFLSVSRLQKP